MSHPTLVHPLLAVGHSDHHVRGAEYGSTMAAERRIVSAAEMDKMTPQERADAVDAGVIRSWDEVDDEFLARLLARVPEVAARLPRDG